jgi:uncharacterized membrane protein YfcA
MAGLVIGLLVSLMGGGGGIFYVGMLTGLFAVPMNEAISISLATIIPTTLAASVSHYKAGNVKIKEGILLVAGGIVGVIAGSHLVAIIPLKVLKIVFGLFLLIMGASMIISQRKKQTKQKTTGSGQI